MYVTHRTCNLSNLNNTYWHILYIYIHIYIYYNYIYNDIYIYNYYIYIIYSEVFYTRYPKSIAWRWPKFHAASLVHLLPGQLPSLCEACNGRSSPWACSMERCGFWPRPSTFLDPQNKPEASWPQSSAVRPESALFLLTLLNLLLMVLLCCW